jgi:hypothetical protein
MKPTDDEGPDALTREYRRVGDEHAGRPGDAVRAAILAEARAAAQRRMPAANDGRFVWRAVAGIGVLGVAVLVWRQVDRPLAPLAEQRREDAVQPRYVPEPPPAAPQAKVEAQVPAAPAPAPLRERATTSAASAGAAADSSAAAGAQRAAEAPAQEMARAASRSLIAPPGFAATGDAELLRRHFPAAAASATPPPALWLLQDAAGNVLSSGELAPGEELAAVTARLQSAFPGRSIEPWRVASVSNSRGVVVQLGIARVQ